MMAAHDGITEHPACRRLLRHGRGRGALSRRIRFAALPPLTTIGNEADCPRGWGSATSQGQSKPMDRLCDRPRLARAVPQGISLRAVHRGRPRLADSRPSPCIRLSRLEAGSLVMGCACLHYANPRSEDSSANESHASHRVTQGEQN